MPKKGVLPQGVQSLDGYLYVRFTPVKYHPQVREALHLRDNPTNVKLAAVLVEKIRYAISLNMYKRENFFTESVAKSGNFELYSKAWLSSISVEGNTLDNYRSAIESWCKKFGKLNLSEVTTTAIKLHAKAKKWTNKTCNTYFGVLHVMYQAAIKDNLVTSNPAKIPKLKLEAPKKRIDPFTHAEITTLFAWFKDHKPALFYLYCQFALNSGLRPQEQIILEWSDIDWVACTCHIDKAWSKHGVKAPKNDLERYVKLSDRAIAVLKEIEPLTAHLGELIFLNPETMKQWAIPEKVRRNYWNPAFKDPKLKVRRRTPYHLRHTYASWLYQDGIPLSFLKDQLGHTNIATTTANYANTSPESAEATLARINKKIAAENTAI